MPRPNVPWFRKDRSSWFVNIDGKRFNLGREKEAAFKEFHRLKSLETPKPVEPSPDSIIAVELFDKFLMWVSTNRAAGTYSWYQKHIQSFIDSLPNQRIAAEAVKPLHVTEWLKPGWSKSYSRGAMIAVQRAFRWGVQQGYISRELRLEKPSAERRDNCPTQADFDAIRKLASDDAFRDLLDFAWNSGARPQEIIALEPKHFKGDRLEFSARESKGKKRQRVIYLNEVATNLVKDKKGERLFLNRIGKPWTIFSIDCRFKRIAKRTGKKFALYDFRHGFCDRMLRAGLDHITVAHLMGHTNAAMVARVYSHIGGNDAYLLAKLRSVS